MKKNYWRYHHFTCVYQKSQSYDVRFLRYRVRHNFLRFWSIFFSFIPLMIPKMKTLKQWKKMPGDIILLHIRTINEDHVIYGHIRCNRQNFLSFWAIFFHFHPPNDPENQTFEKLKKTDIIILHMCTINDNHTMYSSWNEECDGWNFLSRWTVFCPFTPLPLKTQKIKILKNGN